MKAIHFFLIFILGVLMVALADQLIRNWQDRWFDVFIAGLVVAAIISDRHHHRKAKRASLIDHDPRNPAVH